jgi:hypothetical protein
MQFPLLAVYACLAGYACSLSTTRRAQGSEHGHVADSLLRAARINAAHELTKQSPTFPSDPTLVQLDRLDSPQGLPYVYRAALSRSADTRSLLILMTSTKAFSLGGFDSVEIVDASKSIWPPGSGIETTELVRRARLLAFLADPNGGVGVKFDNEGVVYSNPSEVWEANDRCLISCRFVIDGDRGSINIAIVTQSWKSGYSTSWMRVRHSFEFNQDGLLLSWLTKP